MKPNKDSNYEEYRKERNRREQEIRDLWRDERELMKKIQALEARLHQDFPETKGDDPGY